MLGLKLIHYTIVISISVADLDRLWYDLTRIAWQSLATYVGEKLNDSEAKNKMSSSWNSVATPYSQKYPYGIHFVGSLEASDYNIPRVLSPVAYFTNFNFKPSMDK